MAVGTRPRPREALALAACAAAFRLAAQHAVRLPVWEGFDEPAHTSYIWYVANYGRLPGAGKRLVNVGYEETHQPPVYYLVMAGLVGWAYPATWWSPAPNPFLWAAQDGGTKNYAAHHPARAPTRQPCGRRCV